MKIHVSLIAALAASALSCGSVLAQQPYGQAPLWNNYSHEAAQPVYSQAAQANNYGEPSQFQPATYSSWLGDDASGDAGGGCGTCGDKSCGGCAKSGWGLGKCVESCGCWSATFAGLYLRRDRPRDQWLSFDTNDVTSHLLSTRDADTKWNGGFEMRLQREIGCNRALELVYWGRWDDEATATVTDAAAVGDLNTTMNMSGVTFTGGDDVVDWYDDAASHTVRRDLEFHNVEINLIREAICADSCNSLNFSWYAGVRFFRLDDGLLFSSVAGAAGGPGGSATPGGVASLDVDIENNLIGFQIGGEAEYYLTNNLSLFVNSNIGLYGNDINQRFQVYNDESEVAYDINSHKTDVSFLAQIDIGGSWYLGNRWRLFTGYRAVAVTGMALTDDQLPAFLADTNGIADIDSGSSMILHGGFTGLEFTF